MAFEAEQPFNQLPDLPPAVEVESKPILKACIAARSALAELRMAGQLIPNQSMLINSIPILEAQASSEIENIVTTADKLFRFADDPGDHADPATKEALRYRTALAEGFAALGQRPVSTNLAVEICRTIKGVAIDVRTTPGTALVNGVTGQIVYTPPQGGDLLRRKLNNWERYIHEAEEIDPLVRMAVMHYQFEAIHPFNDGNGRTGRVLNLLYLVEQDLLELPVLYLSRYIIEHKADYYRLLQQVTTEAKWEDWILFMLEAVRSTARWTTDKIKAIRQLLDDTVTFVRDRLPKIYSHELVEVIFLQPYCRIDDITRAGLAARQTASSYLKQLAEIGVLQELPVGREKLFVNLALMDLLADRPTRIGAKRQRGATSHRRKVELKRR